MAKKYSVIKRYRAALISFMDKKGEKARVAKEIEISRSYITDIEKKRRNGSEDKRRAITLVLGFSYDNFLKIGELILGGKELEQALKIIPRIDDLTLNISDLNFLQVSKKWPFLTDKHKESIVKQIDKYGGPLADKAEEISSKPQNSILRANYLWDLAYEDKTLPQQRQSEDYEEALKDYIEGKLSDMELFSLASISAADYDKELNAKRNKKQKI